MREIKFRVWANGIMHDVTSLGFANNPDHVNYYGHNNTVGGYYSSEKGEAQFNGFLKEAVIMQYTGLKDKSGKEIYEGDIVDTFDLNEYGKRNMEVFWARDKWNTKDKDGGWFNNGDYYDGDNITPYWEEFEVIGNIYENKELLK